MNEQPTEGGRVIDAGCLYVDCGKIMGVGVGGREIEEVRIYFSDDVFDGCYYCFGSGYSSPRFLHLPLTRSLHSLLLQEYVSFPIQPKKLENLSDAIVACGGEVDLHVFRRQKIHVFKGVEKKDVERVLERLEMYKDDVLS